MDKINKYSIILPVKDGGEYVKLCISSILCQSLDNFDLVVLDNCSADGTRDWIRSVNDSRIHLIESSYPLSIEENWGRALNVPKNEFMTLIGHDDLLHADYLKTMDDLIKKHPDASLYQTHFSYIDNNGNKIRECKPMAEVETGEDFLRSLLYGKADIMGTGFMMRSSDYERLGGIPDYPNLLFADFEFWFNLTKKSFKASSATEGFSFRVHQSTTSTSTDIKMQLAFDRLIMFLASVKKEKKYNEVIMQSGIHFISLYCQGLSHRLLRTPVIGRGGLTVKTFILKCKEYADLLVPGNSFVPEKKNSIWLAKLIDSNPVSRSLFLLFKNVFKKPVLK